MFRHFIEKNPFFVEEKSKGTRAFIAETFSTATNAH